MPVFPARVIFCLKINCEAELLIIRLGWRWQERGVNIDKVLKVPPASGHGDPI